MAEGVVDALGDAGRAGIEAVEDAADAVAETAEQIAAEAYALQQAV